MTVWAPVVVCIGERPAPRHIGPITLTDVVRFAGASGDFNPLHHDAERARGAGFDTPIAMGQYTAGMLAAWLTDWCGVEHLRRFEVGFTTPLHVGDTVALSGEVTGVTGKIATLAVPASGRDGDLLTGSAQIVVG